MDARVLEMWLDSRGHWTSIPKHVMACAARATGNEEGLCGASQNEFGTGDCFASHKEKRATMKKAMKKATKRQVMRKDEKRATRT